MSRGKKLEGLIYNIIPGFQGWNSQKYETTSKSWSTFNRQRMDQWRLMLGQVRRQSQRKWRQSARTLAATQMILKKQNFSLYFSTQNTNTSTVSSCWLQFFQNEVRSVQVLNNQAASHQRATWQWRPFAWHSTRFSCCCLQLQWVPNWPHHSSQSSDFQFRHDGFLSQLA